MDDSLSSELIAVASLVTEASVFHRLVMKTFTVKRRARRELCLLWIRVSEKEDCLIDSKDSRGQSRRLFLYA